MERGRKRKSAKIKKLSGTYRASRAVKDELDLPPLSSIPETPETLGTRGAKEWQKVCGMLIEKELLADVDLTAVEMYCMEVETYFKAKAAVRKTSIQVIGKNKFESAKPQVSIGNAAFRNVKELAALFGITPAARTKISAPKKTDESNPSTLLSKIG